MFLFFDRQVMLDRNMIGVFLSISSAVASLEPRDYRGVFVYTKKQTAPFSGAVCFFTCYFKSSRSMVLTSSKAFAV